MSTSYSAAFVYGLPYELAESLIDNIDDLIDEGEIEIFAPYYDASRRESLVGVEIHNSGDYRYRVFKPQDMSDEENKYLNEKCSALAKLFGEDNVEFYLTTVGY